METAFELFGIYGLHGTSIRMIAKESGVNLAAVNYHFKNKESLFWHLMAYTYSEVNHQIHQMHESSPTVLELAMKTYDYFLSEKSAVKNTMKMMLSDGIKMPEDPELLVRLQNPMGPPGGQYFADLIQKEVPFALSPEGLFWGVKAVFGSVFHWSTMCASEKICPEQVVDPLMSQGQIRKDVEAMVVAQLQFLKSQKERYGLS